MNIDEAGKQTLSGRHAHQSGMIVEVQVTVRNVGLLLARGAALDGARRIWPIRAGYLSVQRENRLCG